MLIELDEMTRRAVAERLGNEIALLSAHITAPDWDGTRLDLHLTIWAMHPRAADY